MKTLLIPSLAAALSLASAASAQVLMFDFGPTTATGANLTNSPYHTASNAFTGTTWNKIGGTATTGGVPDPSSSLSFSDGSAAVFGSTPITVNLGASTASTINLSSQPSTSSVLGNPTNTNIYAGTSVGTDGIFQNSTNGKVGVQIGGLAIGTYDLYVTARNTNTGSQANNGYTQTVYAGVGASNTDFNYSDSGYVSSSIVYASNQNGTSYRTDAWVAGENYVKLSVSITANGQYLNLAVAGINSGGSGDTRGFLNSLQIVNTTASIPEPSAFAALAGLAGLGLAASRRRRA